MVLKSELYISLVILIGLVLIPSIHGIVGGYTVLVSSVPWIVSLSTKQRGLLCGGVLLDRRKVLTAAFCLNVGINPHDIIVRVGSDYATGGGETSTVDAIHIHPQFDVTTKNYNFALLEMSKSFGESQVISSIKLKDSSDSLFVGKNCLTSGYGWTAPDSGWQADYRLRSAPVSIINKNTCAQKLHPSVVTDNMFCAGTAQREPCVGDAGGPLTCEDQLVGIISWGKGCAIGDSIGVYADPTAVKSWLREKGVPI